MDQALAGKVIVNQTLVVLALALPSALAFLTLLVVGFRRRSAQRRACESLLAQVKASDEDVRQSLQHFLGESLRLESAEVSRHTDELLELRKGLYRQLFKAVLQQDSTALAGLDARLVALINAYHVLEPQMPAPAPVAVAPRNDAVHDQLRAENERLRRESAITMGTLNNIYAEFSSMFGNEIPTNPLSVEQIMERMQAMSVTPEEAETPDMSAAEVEAILAADLGGGAQAAEPASTPAMAAAPAPEPAAIEAESEAEPSWEQAFAEAAPSGDEPSWEDAFAEAEKPEPKP